MQRCHVQKAMRRPHFLITWCYFLHQWNQFRHVLGLPFEEFFRIDLPCSHVSTQLAPHTCSRNMSRNFIKHDIIDPRHEHVPTEVGEWFPSSQQHKGWSRIPSCKQNMTTKNRRAALQALQCINTSTGQSTISPAGHNEISLAFGCVEEPKGGSMTSLQCSLHRASSVFHGIAEHHGK